MPGAKEGLGRFWALWAMLALVCFSVNIFLLSAIGKQSDDPAIANISAIVVVWCAAGGLGLIAVLVRRICRGGDSFFPSLTGRLAAHIAIAGSVQTGGMFFLAEAVAALPGGAAPITAMLPLNCLVVSIFAFKVMGEKLRRFHVMGIGVALAGPVVMAVSDFSESFLKGLVFGALTAVLFGASNFHRKYTMFRGGETFDILGLFLMTVGAWSLLVMSIFFLTGRGLPGISNSPSSLSLSITSGVLWATGTGFLQLALQGLGGPASAIANMNSVGVLILERVCFGSQLSAVKGLGMFCCLAGVAVLAMVPAKQARVGRDSSSRHELSSPAISLQAQADLKIQIHLRQRRGTSLRSR